MFQINIERLKSEILELGEIGKNDEDKGLYRMAFTDADIESRKWLMKRITDNGLRAYMDGAGNVFGQPAAQPDQPTWIVGSHLDTVPAGGMLDGALGVLAGLECLRVIEEQQIQLTYPLELLATSDEEGRFGGMLGAQAICGEVTPGMIQMLSDPEGNRLEDVMRQQDFEPMEVMNARRDPHTIKGYLELHIEQGPVLEQHRKQVGIVEAISGLFKWTVRLIGEANHSGTTPMEVRKDAFMGLAEFAQAIPRILEEDGGEGSRATIGKVDLSPGNPHVIPGLVEFSFVGRSFQAEQLKEMIDSCRKALSAIARRRGLMFEYEVINEMLPVPCNQDLIDMIENQAQKINLDYMRMPSGAGHDAQYFGKYYPMAMIFVPSLDGVSHSPNEWTNWNDIESGANLLLNTILEVCEAKV